jgi:predicted SAM-dependent methyltransferase
LERWLEQGLSAPVTQNPVRLIVTGVRFFVDLKELSKRQMKTALQTSFVQNAASRILHLGTSPKLSSNSAKSGGPTHRPSKVDLHSFDKINFGCGYDKRPGYLNVDMNPDCSPDVLVIDGDFSMFPTNHFQEVFAKDVLEHIPRNQSLSALLEWSDFLVTGGLLSVETSSILDTAERFQDATKFEEHFGWTICLFGSQAHDGDFHLTGFTELTLRTHFLAAGFDITTMLVRERWLLFAEGRKVSSWTEPLRTCASMSDSEFIDHIYQFTLNRDADPNGKTFLLSELTNKRKTRRDVLKHLASSPEKLFITAAAHGL